MEPTQITLAAIPAYVSGLSTGTLSFLLASALIAGLARGFSGFGGALIFIPLASSVVEPRLAVAVLFLIDLVMALPMLPDAVRQADKREAGTMLIGALAGVPLGTMILARTDPLAVRWAIIAVVISLLALLVSGWRYHGKPTAPLTIGVGAVAGVFGGAAQVSGPPVVAYWLGGALPATTVRANLVFYFAMSSLITGVNYVFAGFFDVPAFALSLVAGPVFGLGVLAGARLFGKADDRLFRRICYALIAAAAIIGLPLLDSLLR
ncbi:MAG: sulfite exporter TauE/SafE family protein [Rhizobiaceae bacterium]|nr:sulfite exporter TauE/SafE family protein [Rhizobiaceae bacterium]